MNDTTSHPEIALFDLNRALREHPRSEQITLEFKAKVNAMREIGSKLMAEHTGLREEIANLQKTAANQEQADALQPQIREMAGRLQTCEVKMRELQGNQTQQLQQEQEKIRQDLVREVLHIATEYSKEQTYNLLLDKAAVTGVGTPLIIFTRGVTDVTEEIVTKLKEEAKV